MNTENSDDDELDPTSSTEESDGGISKYVYVDSILSLSNFYCLFLSL